MMNFTSRQRVCCFVATTTTDGVFLSALCVSVSLSPLCLCPSFPFTEEKTQRCKSVVFVQKTLETTLVWLKTR